MAKDKTWNETKSIIGSSGSLGLFKKWFEDIVFTKAKVDPDHFFGDSTNPVKCTTTKSKAHGLYITKKGPYFKPALEKFQAVIDSKSYQTWGYADLLKFDKKTKKHIVVTIDKEKDGSDVILILSVWNAWEAFYVDKPIPDYRFKFEETGQGVRKEADPNKVGTIDIDTQEQELISLAIFKAVLQKTTNPWKSFEDMYDDPKSGLKQIHSGLKVNLYQKNDWWRHFDNQFENLFKVTGLKANHYEVYNRDGTGMKPGENFMDYITKLITSGTEGSLDKDNEIGRFAKKDSWNPADIWLLDTTAGRYDAVKLDLEKAKTVAKVNSILQKAFHDKIIKGISLKKNRGGGPGKELLWDEINLYNTVKKQPLPLVNIKTIEFDPHYHKKTKSFTSVTSNIVLQDPAGKHTYRLAFKSNQKSMTSITYEFGEAGMPAQLGKIPKDRFKTALTGFGLAGVPKSYPELGDHPAGQPFLRKKWEDKHKVVGVFLNKYKWIINPGSRSKLKDMMNLKEYKEQVMKEKKKAKVKDFKFPAAAIVQKEHKAALAKETEVNKTKAWAAFVDNLEESWKSGKKKQNAVMMQMVDFLYLLAKMQAAMNKSKGKGKQTFEEFMTDVFYWAQKKGQKWDFGPFGKSY